LEWWERVGWGRAIVRRLAAVGNSVLVADDDLELAATVAADAGAGQPRTATAVLGTRRSVRRW
jgi:NAD(P)-dependent dehydrogenase (short-subunit alcohol dehydrogenase family)